MRESCGWLIVLIAAQDGSVVGVLVMAREPLPGGHMRRANMRGLTVSESGHPSFDVVAEQRANERSCSGVCVGHGS
jgi:hypothetical protein